MQNKTHTIGVYFGVVFVKEKSRRSSNYKGLKMNLKLVFIHYVNIFLGQKTEINEIVCLVSYFGLKDLGFLTVYFQYFF